MASTSDRRGCLGAIMHLFSPPRSASAYSPMYNDYPLPEEKLPYRVRDDFLSPAEIAFYHVLRTIMKDQVVICTKVNLGDLFFVPRSEERSQGHRNKIDRKHVDFVLCDTRTMKPLVGIEVDDSSHRRSDRVERDMFVDDVFKTAGLPLLRFPVQHGYVPADIEAIIHQTLGSAPTAPTAVRQRQIDPLSPIPTCPKCGVPMLLRRVSKGPNQGKQFYGCRNYPSCREMVALV